MNETYDDSKLFSHYDEIQRFVSSIGNIEKVYEFSTVWANRADLGSQISFSKLTGIFPRKTHDNFQFNIQKRSQIRKIWAPMFSNQKRNAGFSK